MLNYCRRGTGLARLGLLGMLVGVSVASCGGEGQKRLPGFWKDRDWDAALIGYAEQGDVSGILRSLEAGADPNHNPSASRRPSIRADVPIMDKSQTPLINAARGGHLAAVRLLLRRGALPNVRTLDETPLHAAAALGHSEVVWLLLEAGANANARVGLGGREDAMAAASARGHAAVVWFLYIGGGRVEPSDLCAAVDREYTDLVKLYVSIGLNPRVRACSGVSPIDRARRLPPSPKRDEILRIMASR
jgi:hypothetical protein